MTEKRVFLKKALLPEGWRENVSIDIAENGTIIAVHRDSEKMDGVESYDVVIPGMPNIHSHAFQRTMAGLSEHRVSTQDTFWTWRNTMYQLANKITPEDLTHIASQLYLEMVKSGYTSVAEFHYVHHQQNGADYFPAQLLSDSIFNAASQTGIGLTHLPVLYMTSGFGGKPLSSEQKRFGHTVDKYLKLLESVHGSCRDSLTKNCGLALHRLRAVPPDSMKEVLSGYNEINPDGPIHIHISEQALEVDHCVDALGVRPVEWLFENTYVDGRWCLVHATHLTDDESKAIAQSGAVVGICPTTEANLGDGIFPLKRYIELGGDFAIGSDSNSSISPIEELRWLEYVQRLAHQGRNISANSKNFSIGNFLYSSCLHGGSKAVGRKVGKIEVGYQADILMLDTDTAILAHTPNERILDTLIFSGNVPVIKDVMISGNWVITNYSHKHEEVIKNNFMQTVAKYRT